MDIKERIDKVVQKYTEPDFLLEKEENKVDELPKQQGSLEDKVIVFLSENPNPSDDILHKWAEEQKLNVHEVETEIYKLATTMIKFLTGGMSIQKGVSSKGVDSTELKMGIKVEKEHTTDDATAERIALDHLAEIPDYYTRLKKMEDEAKVKEEPKKKEEISESLIVKNLEKFDRSRTQTAVKRTIDTLIELEDNNVFEGTEASYVRSVISIMQKVLHKLKHSIKP